MKRVHAEKKLQEDPAGIAADAARARQPRLPTEQVAWLLNKPRDAGQPAFVAVRRMVVCRIYCVCQAHRQWGIMSRVCVYAGG